MTQQLDSPRRALLDARPDLDWFVAPERTYSINDNPNTCRRVAGYIFKAIVVALFAVGLYAYIPTVAHGAEAPKYELSIKLVPTPGLVARVPTARVLDFPAKKVEGHADFKSKSDCEAHFEMADIPGISFAMFMNEGLKLDEDFTIEHQCEVAGEDA